MNQVFLTKYELGNSESCLYPGLSPEGVLVFTTLINIAFSLMDCFQKAVLHSLLNDCDLQVNDKVLRMGVSAVRHHFSAM